MSSNKNPILLTGSHRSGSTWTGKMLAFSNEIAYIHEPFNLNHNPGIFKARFENWFPYIFHGNEHLSPFFKPPLSVVSVPQGISNVKKLKMIKNL